MTSCKRIWLVILILDALWLGTLISVLIDVEWMFHAGQEIGDYFQLSPKHDTVVSIMSLTMTFWLAVRLIDAACWLDQDGENTQNNELHHVSSR